jgi:hypothetical protein
VVSGLQYDNIVVIDQVDEPMFVVDPPRPASFQDMAKRLGLSNPCARITQRVLQESVDAFHHGPVD